MNTENIKHNIKQFLIAIDQFCNVVICALHNEKSWADETMSARAWRYHLEDGIDWPHKIIDTILFFDDNHCEESYQSEKERNQLPPSERE